MSNLDAFTHALREETDAPKDRPETLARIVWSLAPRRRRSRLTMRIIVPIAAALVAIGAFAAARSDVTVTLHSRSESSEVVRDKAKPVRQSETLMVNHTVAKVAPSASALTPVVVGVAPSEPPAMVERQYPLAVPRDPVAPPPAAVPAAPDDEDALYRDARDAHFVRKDPAAAVIAWDKYLARTGPSGRFALEAKYNRALDLARLGRTQEAISALRPFADGEYGGYRREEATRVLSTLEPH